MQYGSIPLFGNSWTKTGINLFLKLFVYKHVNIYFNFQFKMKGQIR